MIKEIICLMTKFVIAYEDSQGNEEIVKDNEEKWVYLWNEYLEDRD